MREGMLHLWSVMAECVERGFHREGVLPGGLRVPRRAPALHRDLATQGDADPLHVLDWVNLYALSVNEENSAGWRIVTAHNNG
ncbi:MAG: L-serine ammonia-lyase, iron-sulfur-dependent, subunit beta, partial [Hydrogenophaga sp.]